MSPITIDHHRSASASCTECECAWRGGGPVSILAVLTAAAEHAIVTGHTVTERVSDDAVVHPEGNRYAPAAVAEAAGA